MMFDTVLLLTGPAEQEPLAVALKRHNPQLTVHPIRSAQALEAVPPRALRRARLLGFLTSIMVPDRTLNRLGFGAYNFHPGPPNYPGWLPSHFATYDKVSEFGVTAHVMTEKVDAGPIIGVNRFSVPPGTAVNELEKMVFVALVRLFWQLAPLLATQRTPLPELPIHWSGHKTTRKTYAAMCEIPPDIAKEELDRRVPIFGVGHFGVEMTLTLHGHRFRYVGTAAEDPPQRPVSCRRKPRVRKR